MQFKIDKSKINLSTFYLKMRKVGFNIWKLNLPRLGPGVPLDTISIYNKGDLDKLRARLIQDMQNF